MIHKYDNASQTRWDHGDFKVQLTVKASSLPMGFCDGSEEDIAELHAIAETEGAESFGIARKVLKSGREIWTLG